MCRGRISIGDVWWDYTGYAGNYPSTTGSDTPGLLQEC